MGDPKIVPEGWTPRYADINAEAEAYKRLIMERVDLDLLAQWPN